jgi:3-deoxy-D-manno-octulosonic-acid transferase
VEALAREQGWNVATRRAKQWPDAAPMCSSSIPGELMPFYACAQVAFVGGSLQPIGGHNLLEPAAMGTAAVTGPHLHNFADLGACARPARFDRRGRAGGGDLLQHLLEDAQAREDMARAGCTLVSNGRGALQRTLALVGRICRRRALIRAAASRRTVVRLRQFCLAPDSVVAGPSFLAACLLTS